MSIISLIKLIAIGAGMFFYYRIMDENNGYYISIPIIGVFAVLLGFSLTLDAVGAVIFIFMLHIFLYFVFTFMAQIDTVVSISYIVINIIARSGVDAGFFGPGIPIMVMIVSSAALWVLRFIKVDVLLGCIRNTLGNGS